VLSTQTLLYWFIWDIIHTYVFLETFPDEGQSGRFIPFPRREAKIIYIIKIINLKLNMFKNTKKGFTLIELLVVIAIIGILSSVVLASLNTARSKGVDASVKSNLSGARAEAELFYDNQSPVTYEGVCATSGANTIGDSVQAAASAKGATFTSGDSTVPSATIAACHDLAGGWAAQVPLNTGGSFCVDSTGTAATRTNFLGTGEIVCPTS
jgi:prepilin-type N-terminal cleavage/methylation domain-containing protein